MSSSDIQRGVHLVITSPKMGVSLHYVMPEGVEDAYSSTFRQLGGERKTHPTVTYWKGGKVEEWSIRLDLVADVSYKISSAAELVYHVETLYSMSLPPTEGRRTPEPVIVVYKGQNRPWFQRRALITSVRTKWLPPVDIVSGHPMRAEVTVTFMPIYEDRHALPHRPYHFMSG